MNKPNKTILMSCKLLNLHRIKYETIQIVDNNLIYGGFTWSLQKLSWFLKLIQFINVTNIGVQPSANKNKYGKNDICPGGNNLIQCLNIAENGSLLSIWHNF